MHYIMLSLMLNISTPALAMDSETIHDAREVGTIYTRQTEEERVLSLCIQRFQGQKKRGPSPLSIDGKKFIFEPCMTLIYMGKTNEPGLPCWKNYSSEIIEDEVYHTYEVMDHEKSKVGSVKYYENLHLPYLARNWNRRLISPAPTIEMVYDLCLHEYGNSLYNSPSSSPVFKESGSFKKFTKNMGVKFDKELGDKRSLYQVIHHINNQPIGAIIYDKKKEK